MSLSRCLRALFLAGGLLGATAAHALCTLTCSCNASVTSIVFATYNPLASGNSTSTGRIRVSCGGVAGLAIPYTVALSAGIGTLGARTMGAGAGRLAYNLYTTSSYSTIWGDGSGATATVGGGFLLDVLGTAPPQDLTVYGRIPGSQGAVAPGAYADTLVVTLTYF